jgi:hypothetical protein
MKKLSTRLLTEFPLKITLKWFGNRLRTEFKLDYYLEKWQENAIYRILMRYDVIFLAGTEHRKNIISEGVAVLVARGIMPVVSTH